MRRAGLMTEEDDDPGLLAFFESEAMDAAVDYLTRGRAYRRPLARRVDQRVGAGFRLDGGRPYQSSRPRA